jgi:hypothetical protein
LGQGRKGLASVRSRRRDAETSEAGSNAVEVPVGVNHAP